MIGICLCLAWLLGDQAAHAQSQGQQDGIVRSVLAAIGETNRYYVEIGFNSFTHHGGSGSNTFALHQRGWRGLLLDGVFENPDINLHKEFVTSLNVVELFKKYSVPMEPDYVSIGWLALVISPLVVN